MTILKERQSRQCFYWVGNDHYPLLYYSLLGKKSPHYSLSGYTYIEHPSIYQPIVQRKVLFLFRKSTISFPLRLNVLFLFHESTISFPLRLNVLFLFHESTISFPPRLDVLFLFRKSTISFPHPPDVLFLFQVQHSLLVDESFIHLKVLLVFREPCKVLFLFRKSAISFP